MKSEKYLNDKNAVRQNLIDAGCCEKEISDFFEKLKDDDIKEIKNQLSTHRSVLLDELHKQQKCIDCLDYLVYKIEKESVD